MSFDLSCKKCGARLRMVKSTEDSFGVITVEGICPNWRWFSLGHDKGKSYSRDANIWTTERPLLLIRGDKAIYEHVGPPMTLCEGDHLEVNYEIKYS